MTDDVIVENDEKSTKANRYKYFAWLIVSIASIIGIAYFFEKLNTQSPVHDQIVYINAFLITAIYLLLAFDYDEGFQFSVKIGRCKISIAVFSLYIHEFVMSRSDSLISSNVGDFATEFISLIILIVVGIFVAKLVEKEDQFKIIKAVNSLVFFLLYANFMIISYFAYSNFTDPDFLSLQQQMLDAVRNFSSIIGDII